MTATEQSTPMPDGTSPPASLSRSLSHQELEGTPAYLRGSAQRLLSQAFRQMQALQRKDPLLARDVADRWADTLDTLRATLNPAAPAEWLHPC